MVAYGAAGLLCALLPVFSNMGVVAGFICLTLVITLSLCPNGCLLALASAEGQGPAMPLNLAVFNSLGNIAGFFGAHCEHQHCTDVAMLLQKARAT